MSFHGPYFSNLSFQEAVLFFPVFPTLGEATFKRKIYYLHSIALVAAFSLRSIRERISINHKTFVPICFFQSEM